MIRAFEEGLAMYEFMGGGDWHKLPEHLRDKLSVAIHTAGEKESIEDLIKFLPKVFRPAKKVVLTLEQFPRKTGKYARQWPIECPGQKLKEVAVIVERRKCAFID